MVMMIGAPVAMGAVITLGQKARDRDPTTVEHHLLLLGRNRPRLWHLCMVVLAIQDRLLVLALLLLHHRLDNDEVRNFFPYLSVLER